MQREQIQVALEAAAKISNQYEFVVAGSLSVLGYIGTPPEKMAMSLDIDFFPLNDPKGANEIASALGEDSAFHEHHGYYLDPIPPNLPVLPQGWADRLVKLPLGSITAYFLEVNDIAISKYVRSAENDYRWIEAGLDAGILNLDIIEARSRFSVDYPDPQDKHNVENGIQMHRAARLENGQLAAALLTYLQHNPFDKITNPDTLDSIWCGEIIWVSENHALQRQATRSVVIHRVVSWPTKLEIGTFYEINYLDEQVAVKKYLSP